MKLATIALLLSTLTLSNAYSATQAVDQMKIDPMKIDPKKILALAESIRNPGDNYEVDVLLLDVKPGKKDKRSYRASIKGNDKALVKFITPVVDRGTQVLMVEQEMWIYLPTTAKPVRIAARQKLTGNAVFGDITRLTFVDNYHVKLLKEETVDGKATYLLGLDSIEGRQVTYDRVEYWVDKANYEPIKANYLTSSGKILRECYFKNFKNVLNKKRPTQFLFKDHLEQAHTTEITFANAKKSNLPEIAFRRENLGRN